jgi:hypothetical protein
MPDLTGHTRIELPGRGSILSQFFQDEFYETAQKLRKFYRIKFHINPSSAVEYVPNRFLAPDNPHFFVTAPRATDSDCSTTYICTPRRNHAILCSVARVRFANPNILLSGIRTNLPHPNGKGRPGKPFVHEKKRRTGAS